MDEKPTKLYWSIKDLRNWEDNPREIEESRFNELKESLREEDQLVPLLVDMRPGKEGTVLGGNMTLRALRELGIEQVWVELKTPKDDAHAFALAVKHNASYGRWNPDQLAEIVSKYKDKIDIRTLRVDLASSVDLGHLLGQYSPVGSAVGIDEDSTDDKLEVYLHGNIRQIVLYFSREEYESVLERLKKISEDNKLENNTNAFLHILDFYEKNSSSEGQD